MEAAEAHSRPASPRGGVGCLTGRTGRYRAPAASGAAGGSPGGADRARLSPSTAPNTPTRLAWRGWSAFACLPGQHIGLNRTEGRQARPGSISAARRAPELIAAMLHVTKGAKPPGVPKFLRSEDSKCSLRVPQPRSQSRFALRSLTQPPRATQSQRNHSLALTVLFVASAT